jgi:hippurate hydrolase
MAAVLALAERPAVGADPDDGPGPALKGPQADRVRLIKERLGDEFAGLEKLYKYLHTHPELSYQEEQTAARLAREMKELGFDVTTKVGGHGVVAVLRNGKGPTVLVRTDMDALPVTEATRLPYASKVRARDAEGREVGVMHACGHDMQISKPIH